MSTATRAKIENAFAKAKHLQESRDDAAARISAAEKSLAIAEESLAAIQQLAAEVQRQAHEKVASLVSQCLATVFEAPYSLRIDFEEARGRTQAKLILERDGLELDPLTAAGGGVVDIVAFALRISAIATSRPRCRRLIIADEPFRFVSAEYLPAVRELIEQLAKELDFQFIMVTHIDELQIGKVVRID